LKAWRSRYSQGCRARSNPGLKLANAFGVHNEPVLYLSFASHQRRDERSFETIFEFTGFGLLAHEIIRYRKANIFCFNIDIAFVIPRQALC
jgi:hypothetical protein